MIFKNCTQHAIVVEVHTEVCSCGSNIARNGCCLGCGGCSARTVVSREKIEPSGHVARVEMSAGEVLDKDYDTAEDCVSLSWVRVLRPTYGAVTGLPPEEPGVGLIVSAMVASALAECGEGRGDIYCPDTGPTAIRENGQVVAVRALLYRGV